jgi:hypothetical protein
MGSRLVAIAALVALCSAGLAADVRTDQKTRVQFAGMLGRMMNLFGGKAAREGITSTVAVKGNRKVTSTDNSSQIIDLSEEKVYDIDLKKKSFKVTTFAEIRRQLEEAQRKAAEDARKEESRQSKEKRSEPSEPQKEVEIDFDVKNTGEAKAINGFNTRQSIMTLTVREKGKTLEQNGGLVLTTDMWLAPDQPALKEVADFDRRYFEKVYGGLMAGVSADQMAAAAALYPMLKPGLERMSKEGAKIEGTAIMTTVTFDAVKSAEQLEAEKKQDEPKASGGIGGMLGGLARKAANKDDEPKPRTTFMTSTVEVLKLATDVNAGDVAIPAGFNESK